jgi:hypothetical protein
MRPVFFKQKSKIPNFLVQRYSLLLRDRIGLAFGVLRIVDLVCKLRCRERSVSNLAPPSQQYNQSEQLYERDIMIFFDILTKFINAGYIPDTARCRE